LRCACIDIGSNTTRLLVAEAGASGLREIDAVRTFLRLAPGADGRLAPETIVQLARTVAEHVARAEAHGADEVHAVATAAIRGLADAPALCAQLSAVAGVVVRVLSGEEEARLAFAGATATLRAPPTGSVGVVDVGGGSSELVVGTIAGGVTWSISLAVGSGTLRDRVLDDDPPSAEQLAHAREQVADAFAAVHPPGVEHVYAVGGSATSLRRLLGDELTAPALRAALETLCAAPSVASAARLGLDPRRTRLLPGGLLLLSAAVHAFGGRPLHIARGGLREGLILSRLADWTSA